MSVAAQQLWEQLSASGLVSGEPPAGNADLTPWYVRLMLGIAAWLAALFLSGFFMVGFSAVQDSAVAAGVLGALLIGGAYALFRHQRGNEFFVQFGLAVSIAGQALILFGLFNAFEANHAVIWILMAALECLLVLVIPNFIHRVWSGWAAATALSLALGAGQLGFLAGGLLAWLVALAWMNERRLVHRHSLLCPLAYGLTLALLQEQGALAVHRIGFWGDVDPTAALGMFQSWFGQFLTALALLAVVCGLRTSGGRWIPGVRSAVLVGCTAVLAAVSWQAPGVPVAVMLLLLGFAGGNRLLMGAGIAAGLAFASFYYYSLEMTLLDKSMVLAATGALVLAARWAGLRWLFPPEVPDHA